MISECHHLFDMTDMGLLHYFLGIEVIQEEFGIKIGQQRYAQGLIDKFRMNTANPSVTPMDFG